MLLIIFLPAIILFPVYIYLYLKFTEANYPNLNVENLIKKNNPRVLFIFPHPDDETVPVGGLVTYLNRKNYEVKVITVTKGEKGDELLKVSPEELAKTRESEFKKAVKYLNCKECETWDFNDGKLKFQAEELKQQIKRKVEEFKPSLIVTYEKFGVYGHPDHVTLSRVITELKRESKEFPKILYATVSTKVFKNYNLPTFMAEGKICASKPEYKFNIMPFVVNKYMAARSHKSQKLDHKLPLIATFVVNSYEYYTTKY